MRSVWSTTGIAVGETTKLGSNDAYYVEYSGVPSGDCVDFTSKVLNGHFQDIFVAGTKVNSISDVSTNCSKSTLVTMRFVP